MCADTDERDHASLAIDIVAKESAQRFLSRGRCPLSERARRPEPATSGDFMTTSHPRILSLAVTGGGFFGGQTFEFADGLNAVIGGRGVGKTTLLEFLRFVLQPDEDGAPPSTLIQRNLGLGRVTVSIVTAHGVRYDVSRAWGTPSVVTNAAGEPTDAAIDQLCPIDFVRQSEIDLVGKDHASLLRLVDGFATDELRAIDTSITAVVRDLRQNAGELLAVSDQEREQTAAALDTPTLEEKLKGLVGAGGVEDADVAAAHSAATLRAQERQALTAVAEALGKSRADASRFSQALARRFAGILDDGILRGPNKDIMTSLAAQVATATLALQDHLARMGEACEVAEGNVREVGGALGARHDAQEETYRVLLAKGQEEATRAAERRGLQQQLAKALAARAHLERLGAERRTLEQRRRELLGRHSELRDQRFSVRARVASELTASLGPLVEVSVVASKVKDVYKAFLEDRLKGNRTHYKDAAKAISEIPPTELASLVRRSDVNTLRERATLGDKAEALLTKLSDEATLYELDTFDVADMAFVKLLDGVPKDTSEVSHGQRATAILSILFLKSDRPLVIDQPEDHLDPRYLCDVVVESLRAAKAARQFIIVTHSPNVPVLGDAERTFLLASTGTEGSVRAVGALDVMATPIQALEGGPRAFQLRKDRYGY
jgi:energy-coupling factor transporter ATP-binding protein EcfA2